MPEAAENARIATLDGRSDLCHRDRHRLGGRRGADIADGDEEAKEILLQALVKTKEGIRLAVGDMLVNVELHLLRAQALRVV